MTAGQARQPMAGGKDWARRRAPDLGDFEELAAAAWARLPHSLRDMCGNLIVRVEDFATEEVLRELKIESPFDLMGLYHGVSFAKKSVMDLPRGPDMVFLYRRPLLDCWADGEQTLGHLVAHVLVHEIGHHFGLSDADMERIETSVRE
jgi:predicted Zn-dependent protease with MMP-like domain